MFYRWIVGMIEGMRNFREKQAQNAKHKELLEQFPSPLESVDPLSVEWFRIGAIIYENY